MWKWPALRRLLVHARACMLPTHIIRGKNRNQRQRYAQVTFDRKTADKRTRMNNKRLAVLFYVGSNLSKYLSQKIRLDPSTLYIQPKAA